MTSKIKPIEYDYIVRNLSDVDCIAYKAIIPVFGSVVFGSSLSELEEGIRFTIEEEIKELKKMKRSIPAPDSQQSYSGKFVVRINPILHEKLALEAKSRGKSLNSYIQEKIA